MRITSPTAILKEANPVTYSCVSGSCLPYYIDPAVERLTGYRREEFSACPQLWLKLIVADDRHRVIGGLTKLMRDGTLNLEYRIVRADGSLRFIRNTARTVLGTHARPARIDGVMTDITSSRHPEVHASALPQHTVGNGLPVPTAAAGEVPRHWRRTDDSASYQRVAGLRRQPDAKYQIFLTDVASACG